MGITQHTTAPTTSWPSPTWPCSPATWARLGRRQSAARPEQRPGRLRHGRAARTSTPAIRRSTTPRYARSSRRPGVRVSADKPGLTRHGDHRRRPRRPKSRPSTSMGENPMLSDPDVNHVEEALKNLEFLVVQDIFLTETAELADVVLPGAPLPRRTGPSPTPSAAYSGSARRSSRSASQTGLVDHLRDCRGWVRKASTSDSRRDHGRDCLADPSYGGITYDRLEDGGPAVAVPDPGAPGHPILHTEKFALPRQGASSCRWHYRPPAELPDDEYPLLLTTDRSLYHYHTGTMTRKVAGLNNSTGGVGGNQSRGCRRPGNRRRPDGAGRLPSRGDGPGQGHEAVRPGVVR